ncbi:MAG: hypothetical protein J6N45_09795 [Alphaproteobacteria bacterium]|nr:hypothetical protein [Alphaproteobacteria bacterium]
MTNYTQVEKDLYDAFNDLQSVLNNPELKALFQKVNNDNLNESINGYNNGNDIKKFNDKILNKMYEYLNAAYPAGKIKKMLCVDFEIEYQYIDNLCTPYITRYRSDIAPYKAYAATKMLLAGITKKKISEILDLQPKALNALLKAQTFD